MINRTTPKTRAARGRPGATGSASALFALMALAALAVAALLPTPVNVGAKKHKHRHKRGRPALIASDTGADPNANHFWGSSYCANDSRVQDITTGGDPHPTATGAPGNCLRRMTVFDGDNSFGERCELGWDNRGGPTASTGGQAPNHRIIRPAPFRFPDQRRHMAGGHADEAGRARE